MEKVIFAAVPSELYSALVVRFAGVQTDVDAAIKSAIAEYLDRTKPAAPVEPVADAEPVKGYKWANVFLPNGTEIKMTYRDKEHHATVAKEKVRYKGRYYSPSRFAFQAAAKTSRNAWRDLWIKRPGDADWKLADDLRQAEK